MLIHPWRIEMFGGLRVRQGTQTLPRFRTQKIGALLAYLALDRSQLHSREQIAGILWPESDTEAGRASLRTALASLRAQLEPPGTPANSVLPADRVSIGLNPEASATDVGDFETAIGAALQATTPEEALKADLIAVELVRGELLSGWYEEWIFAERDRLGRLHQEALRRIVSALEGAHDLDRAIEYAQRRIALDRTNEEAHLHSMQLYATAGRTEMALRQFRDLERILQEELGVRPAATLCAYMQRMRTSPSSVRLTAKTDVLPREPVSNPSLPPAAPLYPPVASLPLLLTRFFGRETEIAHLLRLLTPGETEARLVTLTGPGGSGKTRLAIEVANRLTTSYAGAVTFVSLAELGTAGRIPGAITEALHLPLVAQSDPLHPIVEALSGSPHLLVLDNFEQLLDCSPAETQTEGSDSALLVHVLLQRLPALTVLVTSRQRLDIEGEREYYVPTLRTPERPDTPERLLEFAAVQLFVDRAQAVRADFQLKPQNVEAVAALCTRLEGIPLALELAAAWAHLLSPNQMLDRLEKRFELLVSKRRGVVSRHQTLHAAIDWSYRLLGPELQRFFSQLSVFAGSWTLEATQAISREDDVFEKLTLLVERSFVISEEVSLQTGTQMRYRLLETLREFAVAQLTTEERTALRQRHLAWYTRWAIGISRHSMDGEQVVWLQRAEWELENIRTALHWSLDSAHGCLLGLELFGNLMQYWTLRGNYTEVQALADRFLAHPDAQEPTWHRARCLTLAGTLAQFQENWRGAENYYLQCIEVGRQAGNLRLVASSLMSLGNVVTSLNEPERARAYLEESGTHYETLGHPLGIAAAQGAFGQFEMDRGDYPRALPYILRAVELQRQEKNLSGVTHHLRLLGTIYGYLGDKDRMRACMLESMAGYHELKDIRGMAVLFAIVAEFMPASDATVRLLSAAQAVHAGVAAAPLALDAVMAQCRSQLGEAVFERAWKQGGGLSSDQAFEEARGLLAF